MTLPAVLCTGQVLPTRSPHLSISILSTAISRACWACRWRMAGSEATSGGRPAGG